MREHNDLFYYIILFFVSQILERKNEKEKIDKSINFYLIIQSVKILEDKGAPRRASRMARANPWVLVLKTAQQKRHTRRYVFSLVDNQGAFATLKENLRFSEPLGSCPCL